MSLPKKTQLQFAWVFKSFSSAIYRIEIRRYLLFSLAQCNRNFHTSRTSIMQSGILQTSNKISKIIDKKQFVFVQLERYNQYDEYPLSIKREEANMTDIFNTLRARSKETFTNVKVGADRSKNTFQCIKIAFANSSLNKTKTQLLILS